MSKQDHSASSARPDGAAKSQLSGEHPAVANLREHQRQLDADGCEVGGSRQALDETLALLDAMRLRLKNMVHALDAAQSDAADMFARKIDATRNAALKTLAEAAGEAPQ